MNFFHYEFKSKIKNIYFFFLIFFYFFFFIIFFSGGGGGVDFFTKNPIHVSRCTALYT